MALDLLSTIVYYYYRALKSMIAEYQVYETGVYTKWFASLNKEV